MNFDIWETNWPYLGMQSQIYVSFTNLGNSFASILYEIVIFSYDMAFNYHVFIEDSFLIWLFILIQTVTDKTGNTYQNWQKLA